MDQIFFDENQTCQFNFSDCLWATDQLNKIYHEAKIQLSDVDFIAETEDELLFIEYKNANVATAVHPESFNPSTDKKLCTIAKKYYDSLHYLYILQRGEGKRKTYVYILEYPNGDRVSRKAIKLISRLPFRLQSNMNSKSKLIHELKVLDIDEWNQLYGQIPIKKL